MHRIPSEWGRGIKPTLFGNDINADHTVKLKNGVAENIMRVLVFSY